MYVGSQGRIKKIYICMEKKGENAHGDTPPPLLCFKGDRASTRIRPAYPPCPPLSLFATFHLPAVPSRSPAKLGGRCCCAKLALKCLPGSPVSPTTQSNHIRSLYLCLGQVRLCSCVHPRSTFGVEGPPALNVRP